MMSDIIDRIDELVDEQMADGEPETGYSFGDPTYPKCPHCERHWHGLRLTQRIAQMYSFGGYDPTYIAAEDDSPVVCEGSDFIGPQRPVPEMRWLGWVAQFDAIARSFDEMIRAAINYGFSELGSLPGAPWVTAGWFPESGGPRIVTYDGNWQQVWSNEPSCNADVLVTFGPENWLPNTERQTWYPMSPRHPRLRDEVSALWPDMSDNIILVPASPGYDFSEYDTFVTEEAREPNRRTPDYRGRGV